MNYQILYYVQTNLICLLAVILAFVCWRVNRRGVSYSDKVATGMFSAFVVVTLTDAICGCLNTATGISNLQILLYIFDSLYFIASMSIGAIWLLFVVSSLDFLGKRPRKAILPIVISAAVFVAAMIANIFTGYFFTVSAEGVYSRGPGVGAHWIYTLVYLAIAEIEIIKALRSEESSIRRVELQKYLIFPIIPVTIAVPQFFAYGLSTTQIGICLSIIYLFIIQMERAAAIDPLTGLNNRRSMDRYLEYMIKREDIHLTVFIVDIDHFKYINDSLGHLTGDKIIVETADSLKKSGARIDSRIFISRYGGDEFIIIGSGMTPQEIEIVKLTINSNIKACGERLALPLPLSVSIGCATGRTSTMHDVTILINRADSAMYEEKKNKKAQLA